VKVQFFAIACALGALVTGAAEARQTNLTDKDNGVLGAMVRNGCGRRWLGRVLKESNLLDKDQASLSVGTEIWLPGNCKARPSREELKMTRAVLAQSREVTKSATRKNSPAQVETDSVLLSQLNEMQLKLGFKDAEIKGLKAQVSDLEKEKTDWILERADLNNQNGLMNRKLEGLGQELLAERSRKGGNTLAWAISSAAFGMLFVVAIGTVVWMFYLKERWVIKPRLLRTENGSFDRMYTYVDTMYKCKDHGQNIRQDNLAHHNRTAHVEDRFSSEVVVVG